MKKLLLLAAAVLCAAISSSAQDYRELIKENPAMAGSNMMNYIYEPVAYTPAPKGYKPFYISHYGRHGSRYEGNDKSAAPVWKVMRAADSLGLLSEAGKVFWKDLEAVLNEQAPMYGMLTTLGAREQRGIGERMAENFPEVFKGKNGRSVVYSQTSIVPRCILSMTNFTHSLKEHTKGLEFTFVAGDKYQQQIAYDPDLREAYELAVAVEDSVRRAVMKPMEIIDYFFNDTAKALEIIGDPYLFEQRLYLASSVGHLTDYGVCLLKHFPYDALVRNFEIRNPRFYLAYSMSAEMSEYQKQISRRVVVDFLNRADAALAEGSDIAADLRFGHDIVLQPFVSHLRITGHEQWVHFDQVNAVWNSSATIGMGANFQMIFYKNKAGDVLVKMLHNEKEVTIPALETFSDPYYKWTDLRAYLVGLLND